MSAVALPWGFFRLLPQVLEDALMLLGRNSRWPRKANHGSRPCSSVMRRLKRKGFYSRSKTT